MGNGKRMEWKSEWVSEWKREIKHNGNTNNLTMPLFPDVFHIYNWMGKKMKHILFFSSFDCTKWVKKFIILFGIFKISWFYEEFN